jgi:hypothetical protein
MQAPTKEDISNRMGTGKECQKLENYPFEEVFPSRERIFPTSNQFKMGNIHI